MRKHWKRAVLTLAAAAVALFGVSCGTAGELKPYQGHWVDVNSDTTLELSGSTLVVSYGGFQEKYHVMLKENRICNRKGDGNLGMLTSLRVRENALTAGEMILDGYSREYRFVREERLEEELKITDLSEDMPKTIESDQITDFSLCFHVTNSRRYGLDENWPEDDYSWRVEKQDDGTVEMEFEIMGPSYIVCREKILLTEAQTAELAALIQELQLPQYNGYHMENNRDLPGYSLYVTYESGERLEIRAKGNAADTCVFDLPALMEFVRSTCELKYL